MNYESRASKTMECDISTGRLGHGGEIRCCTCVTGIRPTCEGGATGRQGYGEMSVTIWTELGLVGCKQQEWAWNCNYQKGNSSRYCDLSRACEECMTLEGKVQTSSKSIPFA